MQKDFGLLAPLWNVTRLPEDVVVDLQPGDCGGRLLLSAADHYRVRRRHLRLLLANVERDRVHEGLGVHLGVVMIKSSVSSTYVLSSILHSSHFY